MKVFTYTWPISFGLQSFCCLDPLCVCAPNWSYVSQNNTIIPRQYCVCAYAGSAHSLNVAGASVERCGASNYVAANNSVTNFIQRPGRGNEQSNPEAE